MTLPTYYPDSTKIVIDGVQISGLANKFLAFANSRGFVLKLHAASESIEYLLNLIGDKSHVLTDISVWVDISDKDEKHIDLFDITGQFLLVGWSYSLNTEWPEVEFNFVHNSPIYN
jgi:hypothetical protein